MTIEGQDNSHAGEKRCKKDALRGPNARPVNTLKHSPKRPVRRFSGPTSIPEMEEVIVEDDGPAPSLHGGLAAFKRMYGNQKTDMEANIGSGQSQFSQSKAADESEFTKVTKILSKFSYTPAPAPHPTRNHRSFSSTMPDKPRQAPETRKYQAEKTPPPAKNVVNKRLQEGSREHRLWNQNQEQSPFLRLPPELRNVIYAFVLADKTIVVRHTSLIPRQRFRYYVEVQDESTTQSRAIQQEPYFKYSRVPSVTIGITLLSSVCRQLYQETSPIPFSSNVWCFPTNLIMWNFLYHNENVSRAQISAIKEIVIVEDLPSQNLLRYMAGLEKILRVPPHISSISYTIERGSADEEVTVVRDLPTFLRRY